MYRDEEKKEHDHPREQRRCCVLCASDRYNLTVANELCDCGRLAADLRRVLERVRRLYYAAEFQRFATIAVRSA